MAYDKKELACIGYHGAGDNGYRQYVYANSADDTVTANDFFNESANQLYTGDTIMDEADGVRYRVTNTDGDIAVAAVVDPA